MASLERRVEALEGLIGQPEEDPEAAARWALMRAILDEFALLKSSGAVHYRANVVADGQIPPFLSGLLLRTGVDPVLFACASEARPRGCLLWACVTNEDERDRLADAHADPAV